MGTPAQGIVICEAGTPLLENDRTDLSLMMEAAPGARGWMLPAQRDLAVTESGCAFVAGVWGADATTVVAAAPASVAGLMEPWKALEWLRAENADLRRELAGPVAAGSAENGTRRARALSESLADLRRAMLLDRQRLEAAQARVQALTNEVDTAIARQRTTARELAATESRLADGQAARYAAPASLEQAARRAEAEATRADEQARLAQEHALRANAAEAALAAERATVARLRAEWDAQVPILAREAERLKTIEASRGWRLVQAYGRLLAHPVAGWPLRVARRLVFR
jgi:hypothetical protein